MRWVGHVARLGEISIQILIVKYEGKKSPERPVHRWMLK
jgi:hypothetical protein